MNAAAAIVTQATDPAAMVSLEAPRNSLKEAITILLEDDVNSGPGPAAMQWEFLYRCGYTLVLHNDGQWLYNEVESMLLKRIHEISANLRASTDDGFLEDLLHEWRGRGGNRGFWRNLAMIRDILLYMDR